MEAFLLVAAGMFVGAVIGVFVMCLFQINRPDHEQS